MKTLGHAVGGSIVTSDKQRLACPPSLLLSYDSITDISVYIIIADYQLPK